MKSEILESDKTRDQYFKEMDIAQTAGAWDLLKKIVKRKTIDFKESRSSKYFFEVSWRFKNKKDFSKVILVMPNAEKETLIISGSLSMELIKDQWLDREIVKKALRVAFKNPVIRSNKPFYDSQVQEK